MNMQLTHSFTHSPPITRSHSPAKFIQATTCAWSMGVEPRSCSLATAQEMALLSKMHLPSLVSKAGTWSDGLVDSLTD